MNGANATRSRHRTIQTPGGPHTATPLNVSLESSEAARNFTKGTRRLNRALLLLFAAGSIVPSAIQMLLYGRADKTVVTTPQAIGADTLGPKTLIAQNFLWLVFGAAVAAIVLRRLAFKFRSIPHYTDSPDALLLVFLLAVTQLSGVIQQGYFSLSAPVMILLCAVLALWSGAPDLSDTNILGHITAWLGLLSLGFAMVSQNAWVDPSQWNGVTKAILGQRLLAGFLSSENSLGMSLAAGLPFTLAAYSGWRRWFFLTTTEAALILSASRTSILASCVVLTVAALRTLLGAPASRRIAVSIAAVLFGATILVPSLAAGDSFTNRGTIWQISAQSWEPGGMLGQGPYAFSRLTNLSTDLSSAMGYLIVHGHNTYITTRTCAGLLGVVAMAILFLRILRKCSQAFPISPTPMYFMLALLTLGVLETPLRFDTVSDQAFVAWVPFFLLAVWLPDLSAVGRPAGHTSAGRSLATGFSRTTSCAQQGRGTDGMLPPGGGRAGSQHIPASRNLTHSGSADE